MLESTIVRNALKILRAVKPSYWIKTHGNATHAGEPDVIGCICGVPCVIEFKRPGETQDPLQSFVMDQWKAAGAVTAVAFGYVGIGDVIIQAKRMLKANRLIDIDNDTLIIPPDRVGVSKSKKEKI
jgi:hypothetical protein